MQTWASPTLEEQSVVEALAGGANTTTSIRRPRRASPRRAWTLAAPATATRAETACPPATGPRPTRSRELGSNTVPLFPLVFPRLLVLRCLEGVSNRCACRVLKCVFFISSYGIVERKVCTEEACSALGSYPARQSMEASTAASWDAAMTATTLVCSCFLPECLLPAARIATSDSATCGHVRHHLLPIREHSDARVGRDGKRTGRGRVPSAIPVPPILGSHFFFFFYLVNFLVVLFVRS